MNFEANTLELGNILRAAGDPEFTAWLTERISDILDKESPRMLLMTYTLIHKKIPGGISLSKTNGMQLKAIGLSKDMTLQEVARIHLLEQVLAKAPDTFSPHIEKLIEVADSGELITFLKSLYYLPESKRFLKVAVESLRTNIQPVFEAISLDNKYPAAFFNQQQWNQMYLKAAFIQADLRKILGVEQRANADLARIISDYAHERWAAGRPVDPLFWRPVAKFLKGVLLEDMKKLLQSGDIREQNAAVLCCQGSDSAEAHKLLNNYKLEQFSELNWDNI